MAVAGKWASLFFLSLTTLLASSTVLAGSRPQLCILKFPEMQSLAKLEPAKDETFSLSFLHSVSLTNVTDIYRIEAKEIIQIAEIFSQHGAGLPSQKSDVGVLDWVHSDGLFKITLDRKVSPLVIRVQRGYQNTLTQDGHDYMMSDWAYGALLLTPCDTVKTLQAAAQ